jgi:hypothetical protein
LQFDPAPKQNELPAISRRTPDYFLWENVISIIISDVIATAAFYLKEINLNKKL